MHPAEQLVIEIVVRFRMPSNWNRNLLAFVCADTPSTTKNMFLGSRCIAAPVWNGLGLVGAIGISGPTMRLTLERIADYAVAVRRAADRLSRALGWTDFEQRA